MRRVTLERAQSFDVKVQAFVPGAIFVTMLRILVFRIRPAEGISSGRDAAFPKIAHSKIVTSSSKVDPAATAL